MTEALQVRGLSRAFGATTVLDEIDLSLPRGERLVVVGASGSGKTTLLRLIAGLDVPTSGEIAIEGVTAATAGTSLVPPERRGVAMVFQGLVLFPHLRALDQIAFAARGRGGMARARQLLKDVGLGHRATASLDELSGGERQRIALARALAQEPALLLMDEPFASLDDQRRAEMRDLLRTLLDGSETTLILVTHSRDDALNLGRQVLVLDGGRAVASDTLEGVLVDPHHAAAVRCLGLGQVIDGTTTDGRFAQTVFGAVSIARLKSIGPVKLLVRSAQPQLAVDGVRAKVVAIDVRPSDLAAGVRRYASAVVGGQTLRVELNDHQIQVGQEVGVRINGDCLSVDG